MKPDPAIALSVVFGSLGLFFLVTPLVIALSRIGVLWRHDPSTALVITLAIVSTAALFALFLLGVGMLAFTTV